LSPGELIVPSEEFNNWLVKTSLISKELLIVFTIYSSALSFLCLVLTDLNSGKSKGIEYLSTTAGSEK
jgi:hypothetical protein